MEDTAAAAAAEGTDTAELAAGWKVGGSPLTTSRGLEQNLTVQGYTPVEECTRLESESGSSAVRILWARVSASGSQTQRAQV